MERSADDPPPEGICRGFLVGGGGGGMAGVGAAEDSSSGVDVEATLSSRVNLGAARLRALVVGGGSERPEAEE